MQSIQSKATLSFWLALVIGPEVAKIKTSFLKV